MNYLHLTLRSSIAVGLLTMGLVFVGCDNKETVLDIDTPDGGVEVERDRDDGALSIDVDE